MFQLRLRDGRNIAASSFRANRFPSAALGAFPGCLATRLARLVFRLCRFLSPLATLAAGVLELLAPGVCRRCEAGVRGGAPLCERCFRELAWISGACRRCGSPVAAAADAEAEDGRALAIDRCAACRTENLAFDRALAAGGYAGALRSLVLSHKFRGDRAARRFLVAALRWTCRREGFHMSGGNRGWVVTSVPQHPARRLLRGRDPSAELARDFAARVRRPYRALLKKSRWTPAQVSLSREERRRNLRRSFKLRRGAQIPERVLLIDDVLTTFSTASECARTLKAGGAREVVVVAVARS